MVVHRYLSHRTATGPIDCDCTCDIYCCQCHRLPLQSHHVVHRLRSTTESIFVADTPFNRSLTVGFTKPLACGLIPGYNVTANYSTSQRRNLIGQSNVTGHEAMNDALKTRVFPKVTCQIWQICCILCKKLLLFMMYAPLLTWSHWYEFLVRLEWAATSTLRRHVLCMPLRSTSCATPTNQRVTWTNS